MHNENRWLKARPGGVKNLPEGYSVGFNVGNLVGGAASKRHNHKLNEKLRNAHH